MREARALDSGFLVTLVIERSVSISQSRNDIINALPVHVTSSCLETWDHYGIRALRLMRFLELVRRGFECGERSRDRVCIGLCRGLLVFFLNTWRKIGAQCHEMF